MESRVPELHPGLGSDILLIERSTPSPVQGNLGHEDKIVHANSVTAINREKSKSSASSKPKKSLPEDGPPKGVSAKSWEKFQSLQKKRLLVTQSSRDQRVKELRKGLLEKVNHEFNDEDKKLLNIHDSQAPKDESNNQNIRSSKSDEKEVPQQNTEDWKSVRSYLDVNKHLEEAQGGQVHRKSSLEKKIDAAIAQGDMGTAEKLSDHLSTRDFGEKIAGAFDAKRYSERKRKEDDIAKARKKKKIAWRFDHKERWETKGNM